MKKIENCKKYLQILHKISTYIYLNYERSKRNMFTKSALIDINF